MAASGSYKTKQRELILRYITSCASAHFSADDVVEHLRTQGAPVGKSTVYRYLDKLVESGTVRRFYLGEGMGACYQYAGGDCGCQEHFHLKCLRCGKLIHLECGYLCDIRQHIFSEHRFSIDNSKTVFYGICGDCAQQDDPRRDEAPQAHTEPHA